MQYQKEKKNLVLITSKSSMSSFIWNDDDSSALSLYKNFLYSTFLHGSFQAVILFDAIFSLRLTFNLAHKGKDGWDNDVRSVHYATIKNVNG